MYNSQEIAQRIKLTAKNKGISINQLLLNCGLGKNTVSKMANGTDVLSLNLAKIADYLECSVDYLLGRAEKQQINSSIVDNDNNNQQLELTKHEEKVIIAYRDKPEMQPAVDKLLGVEEIHTTPAIRAARSFGDKSKIDRNADIDEQRFIDAPESDIDM